MTDFLSIDNLSNIVFSYRECLCLRPIGTKTKTCTNVSTQGIISGIMSTSSTFLFTSIETTRHIPVNAERASVAHRL